MIDRKQRYWGDMPARLKAKAMGWTIYWLLVGWMVAQGMLLGVALLVAPGFWWIAKAWFSDMSGISGVSRDGLIDYTLDYVWGSSIYVRAFVLVSLIAAALGGLGWLGTEEIRQEAAKPTLSEAVGEAASSAADSAAEMAGAARDKAGDVIEGTRETSRGWFDAAKGWFKGEE